MEHSVPLAHSILQAEDPKKLEEFDWKNVEFPAAEYRMDPKFYGPLIKLMVSKGVFVNPTWGLQWRAVNPRSEEWSAVAAQVAKEPGIEFVPDDVRQGWLAPPRKAALPVEQLAAGLKMMQEFTRQYIAAGGKVLVGTDSLGGLGLQGAALSLEMQALVDAGVTPMQAIVAATKTAAELGGKNKDLGTVEPGKFADLVVIDGDPLKEITDVRKVAMVFKGGQMVDRTYDAKFVNPIPRTTLNGQLKGPDNGPGLSAINPLIAVEGAGDVTLHISGKRFSPKSVAKFNGAELKTECISESELTAVIPRASLQKVGSYVVTVSDSGSSVKSNLRYFIVNFKY